jgi:hypothetical protein
MNSTFARPSFAAADTPARIDLRSDMRIGRATEQG